MQDSGTEFTVPVPPGPADEAYFTQAQAGAWGETLRSFARFVDVLPGRWVLDVGTGPGLLPRLWAAAGARLAVGCDDSPAMVARAAELGRGEPSLGIVAGDALRLPFAGEVFDVVCATNLLFLLSDPAAGLAALTRVCRPGGWVGLLNPSAAMSSVAAERFAGERGMVGFARFSFLNYGRLAEEHHRLNASQWLALAGAGGLADVQSETRAGGLVVLLKGRKLGPQPMDQ